MNQLQHTRTAPLFALAIYIIGVLLFFVRPGVFAGTSCIGVNCLDPTIFMWSLAWWPYALTHGLNPFITHMVWAPTGVNLTWATAVPSLALLAWPITAIWGPVVSFNVVTLSAPVLAAFATFILCREITDKFLPSLIGGWLFGFSSYELGQLLGHLHIDFIVCIPLLLWLAILRYKKKIRFWPFITIAGATLAFQLGVSTEILATMSFFMVPAVLVAYTVCPEDRAHIVQITKELIWAYIVCLILVSPFLYFFVLGLHSAPPLLQPLNVYVADLLNYVIPTPITAVGGPWTTFIAKHFTGNYAEEGAYLGVFVLVMIGLSAWALWGNRWARALLGMLAILIICSFGPSLHIMGRGAIHLPWFVIQKLPLMKDALPVRLTLYVSLIVSLLAALWLTSLKGAKVMPGYVLAGLSIVSLLPNVHASSDSWLQKLHTPAFFQSNSYRKTLKPAKSVVILPYGGEGDSMLWQALSGMYFRMAGGYLQPFFPKSFTPWPAVQMFYSKPAPGYRKQIAAFCATHGVGAIIVAPGAMKVWVPALNRLHWHKENLGGVMVYRVPTAVFRKYRDSTSAEMAVAPLLAQFGALQKAGACYLKRGGMLATLTPLAAERAGCLNAAYGGFLANNSSNNWTKDGGWLGTMDRGMGVSVVVANEKQAKAIIRRYGRSARITYFPYPKIWKASHPPLAHTPGQVLLVFGGPHNTKSHLLLR